MKLTQTQIMRHETPGSVNERKQLSEGLCEKNTRRLRENNEEQTAQRSFDNGTKLLHVMDMKI